VNRGHEIKSISSSLNLFQNPSGPHGPEPSRLMEDLMDALSLVGYMLMVLVFVVMPVAFVIMAVWEQQPKQEVIIHDYNFDEWTEVWNG
jgi:hypothetical protein